MIQSLDGSGVVQAGYAVEREAGLAAPLAEEITAILVGMGALEDGENICHLLGADGRFLGIELVQCELLL